MDTADLLIYVVDVSSFDIIDPISTQNALLESMIAFEELSNNVLLRSIPIVLIMNKMDLLINKLNTGTNVAEFFPGFTGNCIFSSWAEQDADSVYKFFRSKFFMASKRSNPNRRISAYQCVAANTSSVIDCINHTVSSLRQSERVNTSSSSL